MLSNKKQRLQQVHITATSASENKEGEIPLDLMRKYVAFCRSKCAPRLTRAAAEALRNHYVSIRGNMRKRNMQMSSDASVIPITVRQLEAIVRIAESLAKMTLSREATVEHVEEAIRLFKVSTISAAKSGVQSLVYNSPELKSVQMMEGALKNRIAIGRSASVKKMRKNAFSKRHTTVIDMAIRLPRSVVTCSFTISESF